jgi:ATP-dependent exoDNAse (exonuclease V) beta subunit
VSWLFLAGNIITPPHQEKRAVGHRGHGATHFVANHNSKTHTKGKHTMTTTDKQTLIQVSHKIRRGAEELARCMTDLQNGEAETLRSIQAGTILLLIRKNVEAGLAVTGT